MRYYLLSGILLLLSCQAKESRVVEPAFYHWKNALAISAYESDKLSQLKVQRLYLRFFDVDWQEGKAVPLSIIERQQEIADSFTLIPVVFITNRTMLRSKAADIEILAKRISIKVKVLSESFQNPIPEIQIDCDWSGQSRHNYFELLRLLRKDFARQGVQLSATIRLHQIKYYAETGVPEVDRGVLMFYNTGEVDDPTTVNSILSLSTSANYFYHMDDYPLPLDIALPIFRWGLVFQGERFVRIINNLSEKDVQDTSRFVKVSDNQFELNKSTYLKGYYLYKKDRIRLEKVAIDTLREAAERLAQELPKVSRTIIFYHLDSTLIADYPNEVLQDIVHIFDE